jgi:hypothetical protein
MTGMDEHAGSASTGSTPLKLDRILELGFAFWGAKTLLSAVELGLFSALAHGPLACEPLREHLALHPRGARDFFDALVALGMLERHDDRYSNTPETDLFLDRAKPTYIGGLLEMANVRLYPFWGMLTEGLRTGRPQNESRSGGNFFSALCQDQDRLRMFLQAMSGGSMGTARAIGARFPWSDYRTFLDVGTAQGGLPVQIALAHRHLSGGGFDLPPVGPIFEEYVASFGLGGRLCFHAGDFFADPLPEADVLVMGHILHDWNLQEKRTLVARAHHALPTGGALLVYDRIFDDERRTNASGLLMSLNMLIETPGGFDYTAADCRAWLREAGFRHSYVSSLAGPYSMVVGIK